MTNEEEKDSEEPDSLATWILGLVAAREFSILDILFCSVYEP